MKQSIPACSVFFLCLLLVAFTVGCGGGSASTSKPTPMPTPNPAPNPGSAPSPTPTPTPTPAAHGVFLYVSNSGSQTAGYKLNPDGTLVPLAGSPFAVNGRLAAAGSFLAVSSSSTVSAFQVDPSSGALTQSGTGQVNGGGPIAADATNVYVTGNIPANNSTGIYGFAVSGTGALTALAGSPYTFTSACDLCDVPDDLALNNNFLIQGGVGFHTVGDFTVYVRGAGGVLGPAQILGTDVQTSVTIQHPTGLFSYGLDPTDSLLTEFIISSTGKAAPGAQMFVNNAQEILVDNTNRFLLVLDTTGVVHVLSINPGTGAMTQIGTSEAAGNGAFEISMDNTGRFVFVSQTANPNFPGSTNQLTVFTLDPGTGAMKKLQSYPQAAAPGRAVVIAR